MILLIFNGIHQQRVHVGEPRAYYARGYRNSIPDFPYLHKGEINEWIEPEWGYDLCRIQRWFDLAWASRMDDNGKTRSLLKLSHTIHNSERIASSFGRKHGYVIYQEQSALNYLLHLNKKSSI